jgi:hypothetical protein
MTDVNFDPETGEILEPPAAAPAQPPKRIRKKKPRGNGRAPIPENETPRERFLRVSAIRMKDALTAIDLLASFGRNRKNYEYGEADAAKLTQRLDAALSRLCVELARAPSREEERKAERSFTW